jgi:hypothetical protein
MTRKLSARVPEALFERLDEQIDFNWGSPRIFHSTADYASQRKIAYIG